MTAPDDAPRVCRACDGSGRVCENHTDLPWGGISSSPDACDCGAGAPCPCCQFERATDGFRRAPPGFELLSDNATAELDKALRHFYAIPAYGTMIRALVENARNARIIVARLALERET